MLRACDRPGRALAVGMEQHVDPHVPATVLANVMATSHSPPSRGGDVIYFAHTLTQPCSFHTIDIIENHRGNIQPYASNSQHVYQPNAYCCILYRARGRSMIMQSPGPAGVGATVVWLLEGAPSSASRSGCGCSRCWPRRILKSF